MWGRNFWRDAAERAIRTTAQVIVALAAAAGTGLLDTDWLAMLSAAGMAGVLSVLTSVAAGAAVDDGTASTIPGTGPTQPTPAPAGPAVEDGTPEPGAEPAQVAAT